MSRPLSQSLFDQRCLTLSLLVVLSRAVRIRGAALSRSVLTRLLRTITLLLMLLRVLCAAAGLIATLRSTAAGLITTHLGTLVFTHRGSPVSIGHI